MRIPCPARPESSKLRLAVTLATPASHLPAPPTAAVRTNGSVTLVFASLVSQCWFCGLTLPCSFLALEINFFFFRTKNIMMSVWVTSAHIYLFSSYVHNVLLLVEFYCLYSFHYPHFICVSSVSLCLCAVMQLDRPVSMTCCEAHYWSG